MAFFSNALNFPNLTVKGTPVGADSILISDSAAGGIPKQALISTLPASGAASALVFIATATASASATVDFANNLSATYDNYLVIYENVFQTAGGNAFLIQVGTGAGPTYQATNYAGTSNFLRNGTGGGAATLTTSLNLTGNNDGSASTHAANGCVNVFNVNNSSNFKGITTFSNYWDFTGPVSAMGSMCGNWGGATVLTSLRFLFSSGTITTGTFKLYGIKN